MAMLPQVFDASLIDPSEGYVLWPAGTYTAQIVASDMRPTKDGTGQYLQLEMLVFDGALAGKRVTERLNLLHRNERASEIANRTLSALCRAIGKRIVAESTELHDQPFTLEIAVRATAQGRAANLFFYRALAPSAKPQHASSQQVQPRPVAPHPAQVPSAQPMPVSTSAAQTLPAPPMQPLRPPLPASSTGGDPIMPWHRKLVLE